MITQRQIERMLDHREYEQLIRRIGENGRVERGVVSRRAFADSFSSAKDLLLPIAFGLALTRLDELTYEPADRSRWLVERLIAQQQSDGSFSGDVFATTVAARGVQAWLNQREAVGRTDFASLAGSAERAVDAALTFITNKAATSAEAAHMQNELKNDPMLGRRLATAA